MRSDTRRRSDELGLKGLHNLLPINESTGVTSEIPDMVPAGAR